MLLFSSLCSAYPIDIHSEFRITIDSRGQWRLERQGNGQNSAYPALFNFLGQTPLVITFTGTNTINLAPASSEVPMFINVQQADTAISSASIIVSPPGGIGVVNLNHEVFQEHVQSYSAFGDDAQNSWPEISPVGVFVPGVLSALNSIVDTGASSQASHPVVPSLTFYNENPPHISDDHILVLAHTEEGVQLSSDEVDSENSGLPTGAMHSAVVTANSVGAISENSPPSDQDPASTEPDDDEPDSNKKPGCCEFAYWSDILHRFTGGTLGSAYKSKQSAVQAYSLSLSDKIALGIIIYTEASEKTGVEVSTPAKAFLLVSALVMAAYSEPVVYPHQRSFSFQPRYQEAH
ncbi:hypothetical protein EOPP23_00460 [Endozoicomonas sp. OPT23]|nr:hypothetical protein [Endozoicomonas sp. OPT23]